MHPFYQFCIGKICKLVSSERVKSHGLVKIMHKTLPSTQMDQSTYSELGIFLTACIIRFDNCETGGGDKTCISEPFTMGKLLSRKKLCNVSKNRKEFM